MKCDQCGEHAKFDDTYGGFIHDDGTKLVWDRRERLVHNGRRSR